ncbi:MAG: hypothetical protein HZB26_20230 [Candidatus Hydrogenedentes bacterium]|nr:hypothetical protein [Candidatus Hydrogenedentota bacterium]
MLHEKIERHKQFWSGAGPSLILIPAPGEIAATDSVSPAMSTFSLNPEEVWKRETTRARSVIDWPTDGIPTVRPNFGVVFIPAMAGQKYLLQDGQMPWPDEPLSEDALRAARSVELADTDMIRNAERFYAIHRASGETEIAPYHPDTQGVFDIAHMLWGDQIFYDVIDPSRREWVDELLEICLDLFVRVSQRMRAAIGDSEGTMIHGHGTAQGVYFPNAGARTSEDTAILFSPQSIDEVILPIITRSVVPFGGAFAHFCGRCDHLFQELCRSPWIKAIDVQPGMHSASWLLEQCAENDTVLYSRVEGLPDESWEDYVRRIGGLVRSTGARCVLRSTVFPSARSECAAMLELWRELTAR